MITGFHYYCYLLVNKMKFISCSCSVFSDNKIKIWYLETFECIIVILGHTEPIRCLDLTRDGNLLSRSWKKKFKLWQTETGK